MNKNSWFNLKYKKYPKSIVTLSKKEQADGTQNRYCLSCYGLWKAIPKCSFSFVIISIANLCKGVNNQILRRHHHLLVAGHVAVVCGCGTSLRPVCQNAS